MVRLSRAPRKKGGWRPEDMQKAIQAVKDGKSYRDAVEGSNIKKSTLQRYHKILLANPDAVDQPKLVPRYDTSRVFSDKMEADIVRFLKDCSKMYYCLTIEEARTAAYKLAIVNKCSYPKKWDVKKMAGDDWYRGFMKRHPDLSLRTPEGRSLARATCFNRDNCGAFYDNLERLLKHIPSLADGTRTWNLDETGAVTLQKPRKVISEKGIKQCSKATTTEKGDLVTVCCFASATGNFIPPAMIFPRVNFKNHMLNGAPAGTLGLANKTGWMTSELFVDVMKHFIKYTNSSKESPTLLLYDNVESHLYADVIQLAKDNGVHILTFPPHTTHKLQPLDVGLYGPFEKFYDAALDSWVTHHPGQVFSIYDVASCVGSAHARAFTPTNIMSAFKKTGIFPFDRHIFTDDDFAPSTVTDRPAPPEPSNTAATVSPSTSGSTQTLPVNHTCPDSSASATSGDNAASATASSASASTQPKKKKKRVRPAPFVIQSNSRFLPNTSGTGTSPGKPVASAPAIVPAAVPTVITPAKNTDSGNAISPISNPDTPSICISDTPSETTSPIDYSALPVDEVPPTPLSEKAARCDTDPLYHSPVDVIGFPKAGPRKTTRKGREKGRTMIATDTPEKTKLEDKGKAKALKKQVAEEKRLRAAEKRRLAAEKKNSGPMYKRVKKALFNANKSSENDSDDEESEASSAESDISDGSENFSDYDSDDSLLSISELSTNGKELTIGSFFLRKFSVKSATFFYIGKVSGPGDESKFKVSYLRKSPKNEGKFIFPLVEDSEEIDEEDVFAILPPPIETKGTTSRQKSMFSFNVSFRCDVR